MKYVIDAFDNRPLVFLNDRNYLVTPLTDQEPATTYEMVEDTITELSRLTDFSKATKIVGEEDRGGFIAALMAYKHKLPFGMAKWNPDGLEGQVEEDFRNAYTGGHMYLNGVTKGDKIIIVEDMVDSGGTLISMISLIKKIEAELLSIIVVAEKEEFHGIERIKKETGYDVGHLIKFNSSGKTSKVTWVNPDLVPKEASYMLVGQEQSSN